MLYNMNLVLFFRNCYISNRIYKKMALYRFNIHFFKGKCNGVTGSAT
jgi:hypothetical protein